MDLEILCLTRLEGMACRVGLKNPPVCADPEMRSERSFPGQKHPIMPQLDQSCIEVKSKPLRHTTDQTDLLNPSSELLPSLLQRPGKAKHQDSIQAGLPGTVLGDIGTQQSPELTSCAAVLTATLYVPELATRLPGSLQRQSQEDLCTLLWATGTLENLKLLLRKQVQPYGTVPFRATTTGKQNHFVKEVCIQISEPC